MSDNGIHHHVSQLKAQVTTLEQLLAANEPGLLNQRVRLEQAMRLLQQACREVDPQLPVSGLTRNGDTPINITEYRQAAQQLEEGRSLLHAMIDNLPDFIFVKDTESRFLLNNLAHRRVLRATSQQELWGKSDFDIFPAELAEPYYRDEQAVIQTGQAIIDREEPYLDETGQERWLSTTKTPLRDSRGEIVGLVGISRDITRRKQAEERLQESETLYQSSLDALPQSVYRIDREGRITFGNRAYLANLGLTLAECVGKTAYDFFPPELADKYTADDRQVMDSGQVWEVVESHQVPTTGQKQYVHVIKTPVQNAQGEIIGLQGVFWDVTERYQAQVALAKRATELLTVAEVSTAAATILDVGHLLQTVVDLTQERFGLYHAHIYLLNDLGDTLNLAAGTGEAGRQMVAQGWQIPFETEDSLVAWAARTGQGVIANDVQGAPHFMPHPLLPNIRSELAVPLMVGGLVLGVLDVQADVTGYFTAEEVRIQTTLAAQIAVALQNAYQHEQTQAALASVQQSQELLRTVIDATPDWILVKDREHRFRLVNQGFANSIHLTPAEIVGKNDLELGVPEEIVKGNPEEGIRGFWADDLEVMDSGRMKIIESEPTMIEGKPAFLNTIKIPMRDVQGEVWGVLAYVRNITNLKLTEESMAKRAAELACLNNIGRELESSPPVPELLQWVTGQIAPAMQYPPLCVVAIEYAGQLYGEATAVNLPKQMTHGLYVNGLVTGRIYIAYTAPHDFLNEESALLGGIANRLSGYLENRRLLEQAQFRARREELLRQVSDRIRGSVDVETILRTAAREVGQALGRPAFVYLGNGNNGQQPSTGPGEKEA